VDVVLGQCATDLLTDCTQNHPVVPAAAGGGPNFPVNLGSAFQIDVCTVLFHLCHARQNQVCIQSPLVSVVALEDHECVLGNVRHVYLVTTQQPNQFGVSQFIWSVLQFSQSNILGSCSGTVPEHYVEAVPVVSDDVVVLTYFLQHFDNISAVLAGEDILPYADTRVGGVPQLL